MHWQISLVLRKLFRAHYYSELCIRLQMNLLYPINTACMQRFFTKCEEIKREGGYFFHNVDDVTLQLNFFSSQTKRQIFFVDTYGKYFYYFDATSNTTKYNLRICLPTVVCCLEKNISGMWYGTF